MATLIFSAIGTAIGGPFGSAIGAMIGNQIDRAIIGGGKREGPRLKELAVTTSSYGSPIARHFGTMRAAGSIIWATDLVETSDKSGGKGRPSTTTYSYSASFAVALASRPIRTLGRVWADGNLLRGSAGDLKTGGELRVYNGHGDQPVDPLIASDQGGGCPAFRGLAYCVFESLQLADFGNRLPALTFEIVADDGEVSLTSLVETLGSPVDATAALPGLTGFSDEGGPLGSSLAAVGEVYPLACDAGAERLAIRPADTHASEPPMLPEPAIDFDEDGFGGAAGKATRRQPDAREIPDGLRYYDTARDYQAGLQRADGRARPGRSRVLEFPGALDAGTARNLANAAAERAGWSQELLSWRVAELDPSISPGTVVRVPGQLGYWRIETWEWRNRGVELELARLPRGAARQTPADAGESLSARDAVATPTQLAAYELPWDGIGDGSVRRVFAAVSSATDGWTGAALYADRPEGLVPLGSSGTARSCIGQSTTPLGSSRAMRLERAATLEVELISTDFQLEGATTAQLAGGANRVLLGSEVLQFVEASNLGGSRWLLRGLLRGRGGTEAAAQQGHDAGAAFVLLDDRPVMVDQAQLPATGDESIVAIGLADSAPVEAAVANQGLTLRPLTPVHPRYGTTADGGLTLQWARRARGAWTWPDGVGTPLNEQAEAYLVGLGNSDSPAVRWEVTEPRLEVGSDTLTQLTTTYAGQPLWVRQIGSFAVSDPLFLTTLS